MVIEVEFWGAGAGLVAGAFLWTFVYIFRISVDIDDMSYHD
jgi:hypothetical protein